MNRRLLLAFACGLGCLLSLSITVAENKMDAEHIQQVTEQVAGQGHTSIFYTLEMGAHELTERGLSRRSGVPIPALKTADSLTQDDWRRLATGSAERLGEMVSLRVTPGAVAR